MLKILVIIKGDTERFQVLSYSNYQQHHLQSSQDLSPGMEIPSDVHDEVITKALENSQFGVFPVWWTQGISVQLYFF